MNTLSKICIILLIAKTPNFAQKVKNSCTIGYQINRFQDNFGLGINLTTPTFWKGSGAIRISAENQWLEHLTQAEKPATTWSSYQTLRVGLVGFSPEIAKGIRLYSEGGSVVILPQNSFGITKQILGGYGVFGFELGNSKAKCHIELGGIGTGAIAKKLPNEPIFANGFLISTGFRIKL